MKHLSRALKIKTEKFKLKGICISFRGDIALSFICIGESCFASPLFFILLLMWGSDKYIRQRHYLENRLPSLPLDDFTEPGPCGVHEASPPFFANANQGLPR
jgi:hypothetical protein